MPFHYGIFLDDLSRTDAVLFSVSIDSGNEEPSNVLFHQHQLVANLTNQIPSMLKEGGRKGLTLLRDQIEKMPVQLYVQMYCQYQLVEDIIRRSILYYSIKCPLALKDFRWRIDQKNASLTDFESAFQNTVPPMLQNRTLLDPIITLNGTHRNVLDEFKFSDREVPRWAISEKQVSDENALDVQKMIRKDLVFEDSLSSLGLQTVDLLASGTRRLLRGGFLDNADMARRFGTLMLSNFSGQRVLRSITFVPSSVCTGAAASAMRIIEKHCRPTVK